MAVQRIPARETRRFFQTAEFLTSEALRQVNADDGYARIPGRVGGDGVRVAVIDDGVDEDHVDLADSIVENLGFANQTEFDNFIDISSLGDDGHGTAVAGVIAGSKNGIGSHGVAFNSEDRLDRRVFVRQFRQR